MAEGLLLPVRPKPWTCTCSHARRDHYGGLGRLAEVGTCKAKGCPCRKYRLAEVPVEPVVP